MNAFRWTQPRLVAAFFAFAALGSWGPTLYFARSGTAWFTPEASALAAWYGVPPLLAALYLAGPVLKTPVMPALGLSLGINRFWGIAWLMPMVLLLVALLLGWLLFGIEPMLTTDDYIAFKRSLQAPEALAQFDEHIRDNPPGHPWGLIVRGLPASITFNLIASLPLEIGFRGFLFRELPGGFWKRSLGIGLLWGIFLVPLVLVGSYYPSTPILGALMIVVYGLISSPVLVYLRVRTGSVIAVALFQSMVLTLANPAVDLTFAADPLLRPFHGVCGMLAMLLALGGLYLHDRYVADQRLMPERARAQPAAPAAQAGD